jgi:hypothetical protein
LIGFIISEAKVGKNGLLTKKTSSVFKQGIPATHITLEASNPRALIITAHFFGLFQILDEIWWLHGMAKREIVRLLTVIRDDWM